MSVTIQKYFLFKNFEYTYGSTVRVYPALEKGRTGYEQRAGSWYASTKSADIEVVSCMCGYHVYNDRWAAAVGELLACSRETTNSSVRYAVAVIKEGTTIDHLPRQIFKVCYVLLRSDSVISCMVTGSRQGKSSYRNNIRVTNFRTTSVIRKYFHNEKKGTYDMKFFPQYMTYKENTSEF